MTYYKKLLDNLPRKKTKLTTFIRNNNIAENKVIYLIAALKKGILKKTIKKHVNPQATNQYKDHSYSLIQCKLNTTTKRCSQKGTQNAVLCKRNKPSNRCAKKKTCFK